MYLTDSEKLHLRKRKIKISDIQDYAPDELEVLINVTPERAKKILALAEFQSIPSIGIKFAEDLVFMGFYSISELKNRDGAELTDEFEKKKGYWTDPCVEDQFRLAVNFANTHNTVRKWWNFTDERKKFRAANGYPIDRPAKAWHETNPTPKVD
jgi:hypothetical protein